MSEEYKKNGIIRKEFYDSIREKFSKLCLFWNAIIRIWNGDTVTNEEMPYTYIGSGNHRRIQRNETVPLEYRFTDEKPYDKNNPKENGIDEIDENSIIEETSKIHTLANENNIRRSLIKLNNIVYDYIGKTENFDKIELPIIGEIDNTETAKNKGLKQTKELSLNDDDVYNGNKLYDNPDNTSFVGYKSLTDPCELEMTDIYTFDGDKSFKLDKSKIVKKEHYEQLTKILDRIENCLNKRKNWFTSGLCSRYCQVSCQRQCQISCQGCNTKQCHNQKCGMH